METIKLEISVKDELISKIGIETIKEYLMQQLKLLELQQISQTLGEAILKSGIDWEGELEKSREEAWQKFNKSLQ